MVHEDEFTTYRFFAAAKKVVYLDVSKYNYDRSRTDSITGDKFREDNLDACLAMRQRREFLARTGLEGEELARKADNVYCWVLLDKLYSCYKYKVNGPKVKRTLELAREDADYYQTHPVDAAYLEQLQLLRAKGLRAFGKYRDSQG